VANEWQVEAVLADVLIATSAPAQAEGVYAAVLLGGSPAAVAEVVWAEVLTPTALVVSNVYDSTGALRAAYRWDGASLVPVVFTT
jgi:hypothetical protein